MPGRFPPSILSEETLNKNRLLALSPDSRRRMVARLKLAQGLASRSIYARMGLR